MLIKSAKIIDPSSKHNGSREDILIEKGNIVRIGKNIEPSKGSKVYEAQNLHVSPGWFDMHVNFRDPGYEYKEDLNSGTDAAAFGGFTGVAIMPGTLPPIHSKSEVEYIKNKAKGLLVDVFPIGTVTHGREGKELSEMFDMYTAGAVAFSDDKRPLSNAGMLSRALLYTKVFGGLIISYCDDKGISADGKMDESSTSALLGMKGIPALAEEVQVARDIFIAEYHHASIHIATISTARSVQLIREAKARGVKVSCEVAVHNLVLDDGELLDFDSNYKVKPPLRTNQHITALKKGLKDGTIDVICSDHCPEDEESKKVEFDNAAFGIIGLETCYALASTYLGKEFSPEEIIRKIAINPRKILNIKVPVIETGAKANLTFFNPAMKWKFESGHIKSKSKNTPFVGSEFTGKALGIFNNGMIAIIG